MHIRPGGFYTNPCSEWEVMPWNWRDPQAVVHMVRRKTAITTHQRLVSYITWCGYTLTVDDINPMTKVVDPPSCIRCAVALEPSSGE